jgi:hypothetical protein
MNNRITSNNITELKSNEIFVFGSNQSGKHGKGAAKTALKWGAKYGQAEGLQGQTYGIPTVNPWITNKLPLSIIEKYVNKFLDFAKRHPELNFLVTEIGCGLAGWTVEDIAPLFIDAVALVNIFLPQRFWRVINHLIEKE